MIRPVLLLLGLAFATMARGVPPNFLVLIADDMRADARPIPPPPALGRSP